jgi:biopolymer transport protein ExbB
MSKNRFYRYFPYLLAGVVLLLMSCGVMAEGEEGAAGGGHGEKTLLQTIMEGGPMIMFVWVCILATSVIMVTFIVQGMLTLQKHKLAPPPLVESLKQTVAAGNYQEAWEICNANKNYLSNVLKAALTRVGRGSEVVEEAIIEHGQREATMLRTRNSYLSVIGVVSPMIGLLGTVIGMIGAFSVLASTGIADPKALSGKIGEVLFATASGLFIAIPAFIFYYVFRNMTTNVVVHADDVVHSIVQDIPYAELEGVRIGADFDAGGGAPSSMGARKVSMALTTNCPVCSGAVAPGVNPCPHCGSVLDWAA